MIRAKKKSILSTSLNLLYTHLLKGFWTWVPTPCSPHNFPQDQAPMGFENRYLTNLTHMQCNSLNDYMHYQRQEENKIN